MSVAELRHPWGAVRALLAVLALALSGLLAFPSSAAVAQPGQVQAQAQAQRAPLQLTRQPQGLSAVSRLQFFEDTTRALTIEQVRTPEQEARFGYPNDPLVGKESDRVLWFKLQMQLADPAEATREWLMLVPTVSTHELRVYGPYDAQGRALAAPVVTGMRHPWSTRPAASEQMAWRFKLPDAQPYTVYFRVESTFARIYDVSVWDLSDYLQSTQDKRMYDGVTYGLLLGLMVYGLVLLLVFGEGLYAFYLLTCVCGLLALGSFNGHVLRYPFANWPAAAGAAYTAGPALWAICKLQFGRRLLRLRHFAPRLDGSVQGLTALLLVAIPYAMWGAHPLVTFQLVQMSVVVSTVVLVAGALVAVRGRYWPAFFYFFGIATLLVGISAIVIASWGWIAWSPSQMNVSQGALVAELVVFAVAMASRLKLVLRSEQALTARTQQLIEALGTDALTGASSRTGLEGRAEQWLNERQPFALILLDLNGFKGVNDQHGHAAGDAVLVALGRRLYQQVQPGDMVARLGGDEFAVLLAGPTTHDRLADIALRMAAAGSQPVRHEGRTVTVGMSLGIAVFPADGQTLAGLLRSADLAMYHCKHQPSGLPYAFAGELPGRGTSAASEVQTSAG